MDQEDLSYIRIVYGVPGEFELELPAPDARVDNLPLGRLRAYEEAFNVGLRFPIQQFIFGLFRFYGVSLYTLTPNSLRLI